MVGLFPSCKLILTAQKVSIALSHLDLPTVRLQWNNWLTSMARDVENTHQMRPCNHFSKCKTAQTRIPLPPTINPFYWGNPPMRVLESVLDYCGCQTHRGSAISGMPFARNKNLSRTRLVLRMKPEASPSKNQRNFSPVSGSQRVLSVPVMAVFWERWWEESGERSPTRKCTDLGQLWPK